MKERPILFSTPMVQAILAARKTQTRRVVKPQPTPSKMYPDTWNFKFKKHAGYNIKSESLKNNIMGFNDYCPYGQPGDLLWVRETWAPIMDTDGKNPLSGAYCYKQEVPSELVDWKWRPSIHMPKAAARIFLEITGVRVERLHEISEADAKAEGIFYDQGAEGFIAGHDDFQTFHSSKPVKSFEKLWITINGEESWDANPWVWVVEFKVISTTCKP